MSRLAQYTIAICSGWSNILLQYVQARAIYYCNSAICNILAIQYIFTDHCLCHLTPPAPLPRPTLSFSPVFLFPSGDRLTSIVFMFETCLLPSIDDAAPRLPLSRLSCRCPGPLLFLFLEAGSRPSVLA
jgi:hypothetical protein